MVKQKHIPVVTADQMKKIDELAVEHGLEIMQMMEHAGLQMGRFLQQRFPHVEKVLILAGTGHNGADGIASARFLANWGYQPIILLSHPEEKIKELGKHHLSLVKTMGIEVHLSSEASSATLFKETDIIIDALLGYAIDGNPREPIATLIKQANASYKPVIAFDTPSGLNVTTGQPGNPCIKADETLTLALPKKGLLESTALEYVGNLYLADLGIPHNVFHKAVIEISSPLFREAGIIPLM